MKTLACYTITYQNSYKKNRQGIGWFLGEEEKAYIAYPLRLQYIRITSLHKSHKKIKRSL